jgi:flagellar biosynthesis protein FlhA
MRRFAREPVAVASPVLLCSTPACYPLKPLLESLVPKLVVLSPLEVPPAAAVSWKSFLKTAVTTDFS